MPRQNAPPLIDSHVHTDDERLKSDRPRVLQAARDRNIVAQVVPAISQRLWPRVKAVCANQDDLFACYGLHPCFHDEHQAGHVDELALWLGREKPVAVGECGLDYFIAGADKAHQQHLFAAQLALAREFDLPIVIHARKAVEDVIRMIRSSGHYRGMVHSFNGSIQQATRLMDLGYKLSFGGAVTYERARRLRELVASLPLDALLLETDAPDQPDALHTGQRNEPAFLVDVWRAISAIRQEDAATVAEATTNNAIELFRLPLKMPA
jgi:TatD DNase family protein